ncbi:protein kinase [Histoplasma capsulatum]|uniref:Protein kinase n=1 Tax=Ajellomyces capsulatus TaxID=5037 RepID=A0A8A1MCV9_AJECA|nr:protein kinase [Histoplasma capsulatum]
MPGAKMHHAVHLEFKDPIDQDSGDSGPATSNTVSRVVAKAPCVSGWAETLEDDQAAWHRQLNNGLAQLNPRPRKLQPCIVWSGVEELTE